MSSIGPISGGAPAFQTHLATKADQLCETTGAFAKQLQGLSRSLADDPDFLRKVAQTVEQLNELCVGVRRA